MSFEGMVDRSKGVGIVTSELPAGDSIQWPDT
jgi:hypothetical protein